MTVAHRLRCRVHTFSVKSSLGDVFIIEGRAMKVAKPDRGIASRTPDQGISSRRFPATIGRRRGVRNVSMESPFWIGSSRWIWPLTVARTSPGCEASQRRDQRPFLRPPAVPNVVSRYRLNNRHTDALPKSYQVLTNGKLQRFNRPLAARWKTPRSLFRSLKS